MKHWPILMTSLISLCPVVGCAGEVAGVQRIPKNHRAAGSTCPDQRGPGSVLVDNCDNSAVGNGMYVLCVQDSDCSDGMNGRCLGNGSVACVTGCSYDACFSDSDCPGNQPCECRHSASSTGTNSCVSGGNCRIDAECGSDGFCSPSLVGDNPCHCYNAASCGPDGCADSCGHGYFCHTAQDSCLDDSDCSGAIGCNYDQLDKRWTCNVLACLDP